MIQSDLAFSEIILHTINSYFQLTTTTEAVFTFLSRSLATIQQTSLGVDVNVACQDSLQKLVDAGLVLQTKSQSENPECQSGSIHSLEVTELGKATFKGICNRYDICMFHLSEHIHSDQGKNFDL